MEQETIDKVVEYLIPIHNNLAARISVLYRITKNNIDGIEKFKPKQIFGIRKDAKKLKKNIDSEMYLEIEKICDYFESILTAYKLSK